jgi:hypothetical protein
MHVQRKEIKQASVETMLARTELARAGVRDEFADRLAALEAAISATGQALQLQDKALADMESARQSAEQAQARSGYLHYYDFRSH